MIIRTFVLGPIQTNSYLVGCEETHEAVLIDPPEASSKYSEVADELDLKIKYIVNTHAHFDHTGGNESVKMGTRAELLIGEKDAPMLATVTQQGMMFEVGVEPSPPPDRTLIDGEKLTIGNIEFLVRETPGHSPGSIALITEGAAFVGDTLFAGSVGRTDILGGSFDELAKSIRDILYKLDDDVIVYTGHGPITTIGRERTGNAVIRNSK
ncbi:MBL fold metallo-hydrolase [Candidatus Hydrogenedentota bacterium]